VPGQGILFGHPWRVFIAGELSQSIPSHTLADCNPLAAAASPHRS
jgi:hypothetical protein